MSFAFTIARGKTHLEFLTLGKADIGVNSWNLEVFERDSVARKANDKTNEHSGLIRGVPLELDYREIEHHLENNVTDKKERRIVKADKTALQTVKLSFLSKQLCDKVTSTRRVRKTRKKNHLLLQMPEVWPHEQ